MTQCVKYQAQMWAKALRGLWIILGVASAPLYALVTTDALPKGVRAGAFVMGKGVVSHSFNEGGKLDSIVSPLNRSVTLDDLAEAEPQIADLEKILNGMSAEQLGSQLFVSNFYSDVTVTEQRMVPALLWGITDNFSLGLLVPIVKRSVVSNFEVDTTSNAEALKQRLGHIPQVSEGLQEFIDAGINKELYIKEVFTNNGFQAPGSYEFQSLGDIEIESRYRFLKRDRFDFALRTNVRLPTANHEVDITNLLDQGAGQDVLSTRLGLVHSFRAIPQVLSFHAGVFGTHYFPGIKRVALPKDPNEPLADLNDPDQIENVRKKIGSAFLADVGVMFDIWKGGISLMASYQYNVKAGDRYSGSNGLDYARLSEGTQSSEHGMELTAEISSIPLFLADKALAPAKMSVTWYQPLAGKNVIYAPYGRMDFVLLF
ncbi:hypothetical protein GW916_00385 [bacterium]|nr:hypothetical protein [bacterium]